MNRTLIALISLALLCAACSHNKPTITNKKGSFKVFSKTQDTLAYTYEGDSGEGVCDCNYIGIGYPVFKTKTRLNDTVKKMVVAFLHSYDEDDRDTTKSLAARVKIVVKNNTSEIDTSEGQMHIASTYDLNIIVKSQDSNLLILETSEEISGGAHPNTSTGYLNWDIKKDEEIVLADVLIDNYKPKLDAIADKIIREEKLNEDLLEGDTFALNSNYYFAPDGIHFYYNSYEIKPYVFGPTDLLIPYSKIKKLIRPGSVLSQYIK